MTKLKKQLKRRGEKTANIFKLLAGKFVYTKCAAAISCPLKVLPNFFAHLMHLIKGKKW